ncbi:helix-turn-helix transcriptional regulator [uncultured Clostridium sp.]|uniref:helix-turn-helix domain-containing protein n=1 Tax=uncultured Clostridium sp. TaxID=59620 RepID=UPI0025FAAFFC|nr:helix-turn-helix transcriptional regulator [uncultured Clostridium sp.]
MIRSNLSILLAERNLKISKVSEVTKISRTTLTALSSNSSKGIQLDTINTLCNFLLITPEKLISYIPVDINITSFTLDGDLLQLELDIIKNMQVHKCGLTGNCYPTYNDEKKVISLDVHIEPYDEELNSNDEDLIEENKILIDTFNKLPVPFRNDIELKILNNIEFAFGVELQEQYELTFTWDNKLIFGK